MAFELVVPQGSRAAGRTIADLAADPAFPRTCVFAAMSEGGTMEAPRGSSLVRAEMALLLVVQKHDLGAAIEFFMRPALTR
jgi:trk system potassium uptake protein TrkA